MINYELSVNNHNGFSLVVGYDNLHKALEACSLPIRSGFMYEEIVLTKLIDGSPELSVNALNLIQARKDLEKPAVSLLVEGK